MKPEDIPRRVDKRIADATHVGRREIERWVQAGRVRVEDETGRRVDFEHPGHIVLPTERVFVDAEEVRDTAPKHYAVLYKPQGVITTLSEPRGRPCVAPWARALGRGVAPVGRLDQETTGLLVLTDDGGLTFMMLKPMFHVDKVYHMKIRGRVSPRDPRLAPWTSGVEIGAEALARARSIQVSAGSERVTWVRAVLHEGRKRQVRRMCRATRLALEHLHRVRVANLRLSGMNPGDCRRLEAQEVDALWDTLGGRELPVRRALAALVRRAERERAMGKSTSKVDRWLSAHGWLDPPR
ncbi:MAG: pseudouridine synthase [Myxococcota bacterium]